MRVIVTIFSIALLSWLIAGMPMQVVKIRTLKQSVGAGHIPYVNATFTEVRPKLLEEQNASEEDNE